jgi:hypothetical protein
MMRVPAAFEPAGKAPPRRGHFALRFWSVRHARFLEALYARFERALVRLASLFRAIGWERVERPVAAVERIVKRTLFDCRMCGQCILSSTGMSCPMNCPKNLRNGPCGGVRSNGNCEVYPEMPCVWVDAWQGSRAMRAGDAILDVQPAIDNRLKGTSSWLRVARARSEARPDASARRAPAP